MIVSELTAPQRLAPYAVAFSGDVRAERDQHAPSTGRIVLLHDPSTPASWGGDLRVICYAKAPVEPEMAEDPILTDVMWAWLIDSLDDRGASYHSPAGTASTTTNTGYGELGERQDSVEIELRASWTPDAYDLGPHLEAWTDLLCHLAGIPPLPDGVRQLDVRRRTHGAGE